MTFLEDLNRPAFEVGPVRGRNRCRALPPLASDHRNLKGKIAYIQQAVTQFYGIGAAEMVASSRGQQTACWARQVAMWFCSSLTRATSLEIGEAFKRERSSVSYSLSNVATAAGVYAEVRAELATLRRILEKELARL